MTAVLPDDKDIFAKWEAKWEAEAKRQSSRPIDPNEPPPSAYVANVPELKPNE